MWCLVEHGLTLLLLHLLGLLPSLVAPDFSRFLQVLMLGGPLLDSLLRLSCLRLLLSCQRCIRATGLWGLEKH